MVGTSLLRPSSSNPTSSQPVVMSVTPRAAWTSSGVQALPETAAVNASASTARDGRRTMNILRL